MILHKWVRLSPPDRRLLFRAALLVAFARMGLWVLPLATVRRLASKTKASKRLRATSSPERVAWAVRSGSRVVPHATCLVQAIAAQTLLTQFGIESQLHIGVALGDQQQFQAHAWVEQAGRIIIGGAQSENYTPLLSLDQ